MKPDDPTARRTRLDLPVLFESMHELAVVKPAGMATELTSDPKGVSLIARVRAGGVTAKLPHRLDRVTRGIVVVALTDEAIRFHRSTRARAAPEPCPD